MQPECKARSRKTVTGQPVKPTTETEADKLKSAENSTSLLTPKSKSKGRPTKSELLLRERTSSCGSINRYLAINQEAKRKRKEDQSDTSPNNAPAKKYHSIPQRLEKTGLYGSVGDLSASYDKEEPTKTEMDKIVEELRSMREDNARHLSNVSAQIAAASDKHDKNIEELQNELRKRKEDSAQRYQDLQLQIKTLEQKFTAKENVIEDKLKVMEEQLTEAQNTKYGKII
ncbi:hypothetical protein ACS0PU_010386 [Formica fusca]